MYLSKCCEAFWFSQYLRKQFYACYFIVQELCENRGGHPGLSNLTSLKISVDVKKSYIEPCSYIGLSLSLICQPTSKDTKHHMKEGKKACYCRRFMIIKKNLLLIVCCIYKCLQHQYLKWILQNQPVLQ